MWQPETDKFLDKTRSSQLISEKLISFQIEVASKKGLMMTFYKVTGLREFAGVQECIKMPQGHMKQNFPQATGSCVFPLQVLCTGMVGFS